MIAYLEGEILRKTEKTIILKTGQVGYLVHAPLKLISEKKVGEELKLFIHHNIREDASELFGFADSMELDFFKQIIQINGIGPKMGLEIINSDINKIKSAILNEDSAILCKVPGVGQKTAKRIILELKNKIDLENLPGNEETKYEKLSDIHNDAIEALIKLGYQRHQISRTLRNLPEEFIEAEEIITFFLKNI